MCKIRNKIKAMWNILMGRPVIYRLRFYKSLNIGKMAGKLNIYECKALRKGEK